MATTLHFSSRPLSIPGHVTSIVVRNDAVYHGLHRALDLTVLSIRPY